MSPGGRTSEADGPRAARRPIDVLYVSLGTTIGLRNADEQLVAALRSGGLDVELVTAGAAREVRTLMLTDFVQARAAARATRKALRLVDPGQIIYSTTTAALLWPRPGAIRFDALAQVTRPGHNGWWQRRLERRRLRSAPLLIPCDEASLDGAPPEVRERPQLVVPIAITVGEARAQSPEPFAGPAADGDLAPIVPVAIDAWALRHVDEILDEACADERRPVAVTYAADPRKKGLDRVLQAWSGVRHSDEVLLVTGRAELPAEYGPLEGVRVVGRLEPAEFRALVRAVGVFVIAPRREDYGLVQLEALAEGARVVTTAAPGPYAALPLVRTLWPEQVAPDGDDPHALGAAIRHAIDADLSTEDLLRAAAAVGPWKVAAVREKVERELIPALRGAADR